MGRELLTFLAVVALTVPVAQGYGVRGDAEPSTKADATDGYMFTFANTDATNRVYFNAFGGQCLGYAPCRSTTVNPNLAAAGSGHQVYPYQAFAMLGIWRDCNGDGFVGLGDNALLEYHVRLLNRTDICPAQRLPADIPRNWLPPHNDGTLVREWLPIGWDRQPGSATCKSAMLWTCSDVNVFNVNDSDARVWGDWGEPGERPGLQCYVRPHPKGTWHSVGGMVSYADCFASNKIRNTLAATGLTDEYDAVKGRDCASSYVTGPYTVGCNPWGETSQESHVDAFDCRKDDQAFQPPQNVTVAGQFVVIGSTVNVSKPRDAPTTTTRGSLAGTFNETHSDFDDCRDNNPNDPGLSDLPYWTEGNLQNQNGRRTKHDQVLSYSEGIRPTAPVPVYQALLGPSGPEDFGVGVRGIHSFEGYWVGNTVTAASRNPYLDRDTLQPMRVTYTTYYASVGAGVISRHSLVFPGGSGAYGSEACPLIGSGASDATGWACDPDEWWPLDSAGKQTMPRTTTSMGRIDVGVRVGQPYQLRDVDCHDESAAALREQGVSYGLLTGSVCV